MDNIEKIQAAMDQYRREWQLTNPAPRMRKIQKMDFLQFYLFLPVALLGPLVSAFRTAALLAETAAFENPLFIAAEALLGTLFFELGAIVYQVIRLRRKAQEADGKLPRVGTAWVVIGMIITIGAVTTSNFVEVMIAALERADANFIPEAVVAALIGLFIGPGVAVCSVIAGEVVGRFLLELQAARSIVVEEHEEAMAIWEKKFFGSWRSAKGGKKFLAAYLNPVDAQPEKKSRSEYSEWDTVEERQAQIVAYVMDHDPEGKGVERKDVITAVFNGKPGGTSMKYQAIKDLEESGELVQVAGRRVAEAPAEPI